MKIPVIDIFAGPGGLGEGFSALIDSDLKRKFKIVLSIEKDTFAHQTLTLRSFYHQFDPKTIPEDYYEFLSGKISLDTYRVSLKSPKKKSARLGIRNLKSAKK